MNMGLALWFMFEFVLFLVFCMFETFGSYFVVCLRLHSYLFCIFCQITKKYTLYFCTFVVFSITSKNALCIFVFFLYFSIPSQIALCPFVFFVL